MCNRIIFVLAAVGVCLLAVPPVRSETSPAGGDAGGPPLTARGERLPASSAAVELWWALSGWKINRKQETPAARGEAIEIHAARNEAEAAQLVVRPAEPLRGFRIEVADLRGEDGARLPAATVEVLRVRNVDVARPTDAAGAVGPWPDPLPPLRGPLALEAGVNHAFWVRVTVPRDAAAGEHTGVLRLVAEGFDADVPLRVRVRDFALPDRMSCTTAFGFSLRNVWRYHRVEDERERRAVLEKYLRNFAAHHISPYDPAPLDPVRVAWPRRDGLEAAPLESLAPVLDWSAWDAAMEHAVDELHFTSFRLRVPGMGGGTFHSRVEPELLGFGEDTPQYRALFTSYCRQVEEHLRERGWLDEAYVYWFDEPAPKDYAFVMNGFRKLREAAPAIPRMLTEEVQDALVGGPTIWCPVSNAYEHEAAEKRRAHGERFWWYVCTGPKAPYAGLFIDHPATELRVWLWQTWQRGIDGILVWQTNYWTSDTAYPDPDEPQDPYADPMGWRTGYGTPRGERRPWGNGDGRFIYPPEAATGRQGDRVLDGPVDSIRWEMLRDGIEDYEYLATLRRLLREHGPALEKAARTEWENLLEVPPAITSSMTEFTGDPAPIEARRREVAGAIEAIGSAPDR